MRRRILDFKQVFLCGLTLNLPDSRPNQRHFQEVPADADKQLRFFCGQKCGKRQGSIRNKQTFFLVRKPALCAKVRGIFADADAVARRKVR
jgi:hypothetical protein